MELTEGAKAYSDRNYILTNVPEKLLGLKYYYAQIRAGDNVKITISTGGQPVYALTHSRNYTEYSDGSDPDFNVNQTNVQAPEGMYVLSNWLWFPEMANQSYAYPGYEVHEVSLSSEAVVKKTTVPDEKTAIMHYFAKGNRFDDTTVGLDFDVGEKDVFITHVGAFDSEGLGFPVRPVQVGIYAASNPYEPLYGPVSFSLDDPGELENGTRFKKLNQPWFVSAGTRASLVSFGYGLGQPCGDSRGSRQKFLKPWKITESKLIKFVGMGRYGGSSFIWPTSFSNGPPDRFAAGSFKFEDASVQTTAKAVEGKETTYNHMTGDTTLQNRHHTVLALKPPTAPSIGYAPSICGVRINLECRGSVCVSVERRRLNEETIVLDEKEFHFGHFQSYAPHTIEIDTLQNGELFKSIVSSDATHLALLCLNVLAGFSAVRNGKIEIKWTFQNLHVEFRAATIRNCQVFAADLAGALDTRKELTDDVKQMWTAVAISGGDNFLEIVKRVLDRWDPVVLANCFDIHGRKVMNAASPHCLKLIQEKLLFCGKYKIQEGAFAHQSRTSCVVFATDERDEENPGRHVALKFMLLKSQFERELSARSSFRLSPEFVIGIICTHTSDTDERYATDIVKYNAFESFKYCVVMPMADRNLLGVLHQENIAGSKWEPIKFIARQVAEAIQHLHERGILHADLKPLNIMRSGSAWQLIDLDAAAPFGSVAGLKSSTAYCPPEMIHVRQGIARVKIAADGDELFISGAEYSLLAAEKSFDMWGFGAVLYFLCAGQALFHANLEDNIDQAQLLLLSQWSGDLKIVKLSKINDRLARNLVSRLLEFDPRKRPPSFAHVLAHPFFSGKQATRLIGEKSVYDIFISYRVDSDAENAVMLHRLLEERGLKVFLDKLELKDGMPWEEGFAAGLVNSDVFVPIMSKRALHRLQDLDVGSSCDNVLLEYNLALELSQLGMIRKLFPVMLGDEEKDFFQCGGFPKTKDIIVNRIEEKVSMHLSNQGMGAPILDLTIAGTIQGILANQGLKLFPENTWEIAADKIASLLK